MKCIDLDECKTSGYCDNGKCTNKPDGKGFICDCKKGYVKTVDGKTCEGMVCMIFDINEHLLTQLTGSTIYNELFCVCVCISSVDNRIYIKIYVLIEAPLSESSMSLDND